MRIRAATHADVPAMTRTLNWAIANTDVIFRSTPVTEEQRSAHLDSLQSQGYPCLVAESDDGAYLGWATYRPYGDPSIWIGCCETTIYLDPQAHGKGVGSQLLGALLDLARADDKVHTLLALVVSTNTASLKLHEKFGFGHAGTLRQVSRKFDRWLDLTQLQLVF